MNQIEKSIQRALQRRNSVESLCKSCHIRDCPHRSVKCSACEIHSSESIEFSVRVKQINRQEV